MSDPRPARLPGTLAPWLVLALGVAGVAWSEGRRSRVVAELEQAREATQRLEARRLREAQEAEVVAARRDQLEAALRDVGAEVRDALDAARSDEALRGAVASAASKGLRAVNAGRAIPPSARAVELAWVWADLAEAGGDVQAALDACALAAELARRLPEGEDACVERALRRVATAARAVGDTALAVSASEEATQYVRARARALASPAEHSVSIGLPVCAGWVGALVGLEVATVQWVPAVTYAASRRDLARSLLEVALAREAHLLPDALGGADEAAAAAADALAHPAPPALRWELRALEAEARVFQAERRALSAPDPTPWVADLEAARARWMRLVGSAEGRKTRGEALRGVASAERALGRVAFGAFDYEGAAVAYGQAVAALREAGAEVGPPQASRMLVEVYDRLGHTQLRGQAVREALVSFQAGLALRQALREADPSWEFPELGRLLEDLLGQAERFAEVDALDEALAVAREAGRVAVLLHQFEPGEASALVRSREQITRLTKWFMLSQGLRRPETSEEAAFLAGVMHRDGRTRRATEHYQTALDDPALAEDLELELYFQAAKAAARAALEVDGDLVRAYRHHAVRWLAEDVRLRRAAIAALASAPSGPARDARLRALREHVERVRVSDPDLNGLRELPEFQALFAEEPAEEGS